MSVRAPFSLIPGRREICHGSLVVYGSVLELHFKPYGRLERWRIDDVQTLQRHFSRKFCRLPLRSIDDAGLVNRIW